jgi:hypothetical protein
MFLLGFLDYAANLVRARRFMMEVWDRRFTAA